MHECGQHGRVEIDHRARFGLLAGLNQFIAGRNDTDFGPRFNPDRGMTGGEKRPEIVGAQAMRARQQQFCRNYVFAHQAHMIPRRHRLEDFDRALVDLMDLFDHDHRVGPGG